MKKTKKNQQKAKKAFSRRTFNKTLGTAALALLGSGVAYRYFHQDDSQSLEEYYPSLQLVPNNTKPDSPLYLAAKTSPTEQEKWVKETLAKHSIDDLFEEVIIVTPENGSKYKDKYDKEKIVDASAVQLLTSYEAKPEDIGTKRILLPKLYVSTEAFRISEGDLTSIIAFHEANHAWIARNGFGFIDMDYFWHNNHTNFNISMFMTVSELEAHKEELEKGKDIMSNTKIMEERRHYMSHYVQLWINGSNLRDDITEPLKVRYFQPWMKEMDSIGVSGEDGKIQLEYYGPKAIRFVSNGKIQFEFNYENSAEILSFPLPPKALRK